MMGEIQNDGGGSESRERFGMTREIQNDGRGSEYRKNVGIQIGSFQGDVENSF